MDRAVVLGRFQPFHNGHASLLTAALSHGERLMVAIGSSTEEPSLRNPWSADEREAMVRAWLGATHPERTKDVEVCHVPDINNPPRWVEHASAIHGTGTLVTSDGPTATLYRDAGWNVIDVDLTERPSWEGWRVRETARMLSTVGDEDAVRAVLGPLVPEAVLGWLLDHDGLYRLSLLREGPVVG